MNIVYVNHSLGNCFKDTIELNENLKHFPELHDQVLSHELKHTDQTFSKEDLILDLTENNVNKLELLKFMLMYPRSFFQLMPFYWSKKHGFVFDINLIIVYTMLISCIGLGFYLTTVF